MIGKLTTTIVTTVAIGLGAMGVSTTSANAGGGHGVIEYSHGHNRIELRYGRDHHRGHRPRVKKRKFHHHVCRPGRAIHKAERRGVRRAHIERVGRRFVVVEGRKRGNKIRIGFYRDSRKCKTAWVKRYRDRHHGRHYDRDRFHDYGGYPDHGRYHERGRYYGYRY